MTTEPVRWYDSGRASAPILALVGIPTLNIGTDHQLEELQYFNTPGATSVEEISNSATLPRVVFYALKVQSSVSTNKKYGAG